MSEETPVTFKNILSKPGLQIWTINNMDMVPVPQHAFGNFFEGDCYIVLHESNDSAHSKNIHYWIGNTSSQDEQGAASIYVTQLDEFLGGSPIQHREVQGFESSKFQSYFKNGIVYKKGGVASGFHHVETNVYNILRLLHIKGRKRVRATEVPVSWDSFNAGDIFLLDMGKVIVQWNGPQSNRREKLKAVLLAQDIRDRERGGRAQIGVVEGGDEGGSPELMKIMRAVLGQREGQLQEAIPDTKPGVNQIGSVRLYHVSDASGSLVVQEVATQPLTQDLLRSSDCYIVDRGGASIAVWKGKGASREERSAALGRAVGFIRAKNYPSSTNVEVMAEDGESAMFKHLFKSWRDKNQTQGLGGTYSLGKIAKVSQDKFDIMELHALPELAAQQRMVDDASGEVQVWRIEKLELQELHPSSYGQFYGGDCYLILYTYKRTNQLQYILYMWLGRHATQDEITACAYQAVNVDNKYNGAPVQVRLTMGKEPRHFLAIFKGRLIIFEGGTGRPGVGSLNSGDARLFQVRGAHMYNTKATEVPARAASLNTNDVFLLKTDRVCYLWYGKGCSGDEREMGKYIADILSKQDKQVVTEGQEPVEFWVELGGKALYACDKRFQVEEPAHNPRLFECSNQTGRFRMTEVEDFTQEDLDEEDVMLLDTWEEIFLWIGRSANEYESKEACTSAVEYLKTHPAGRDPGTPLITVKQGYEPPTFTGWFNAWDAHKWSGGSSYEEMKNKLGDIASISQITVNLKNTDLNLQNGSSGGYSAPGGPINSTLNVSGPASKTQEEQPSSVTSTATFTTSSGASASGTATQVLLNRTPDELPDGVNPSKMEEYLSDAEFQARLGSARADFYRLPKWRQNHLKKEAGLF